MIFPKIKLYADFVVIKHTLFAIPFAYLGSFLASNGVPKIEVLFWIGLAFTGARSAAMAINNLVDKDIDSKNPRTANRALPSGKISVKEVTFLIAISYAVLFYSAYMLNPICLMLAPIIPITAVIYPYMKRFSPLSHLVLGLNLGYAPVGGWLAVTGTFNIPFTASETAMLLLLGAVTLWVAGFDVIYSLQDIDFDKKMGLNSIPVAFGIGNALKVSYAFHLLMFLMLVSLFLILKSGAIFAASLVVIGALILYEHRIVNENNFENVPVAFFNVNAAVSISMLVFTILDVLVPIKLSGIS